MTTSINGLAVHVEGTGAPVVLIHSGVADHRMWDEVAPALAASYTVVRYDLRGFGASPPPAAGFRHVDDLAGVLDHLALPRAVLVGSSFGGKVALDLALTRPERVARLALLAPPLAGWDWSARMREYGAAEERALQDGDLDAAVRINLDMWVRGPARPWSPELRAIADRIAGPMRVSLANQEVTEEHHLDDAALPAAGRLGEVGVPALVGVGDRDVPDFVAIARHLAAAIPGARAVDFPDTGHLIPVEQPRRLTAALLPFLG